MEAPPFKLSLIVAVADNGVIGRNGKLPWRLGSDLRRFRKLSMGHPLIMGRKTFESIGKPLDGRDSIVLTRSPLDAVAAGVQGVFAAPALEDAISVAQECARARGVQEIFVIGGAEVFSLTTPMASRVYLTRVHGAPVGDVFWRVEFGDEWLVRAREERPASDRDEFPVTDLVLERIKHAG